MNAQTKQANGSKRKGVRVAAPITPAERKQKAAFMAEADRLRIVLGRAEVAKAMLRRDVAQAGVALAQADVAAAERDLAALCAKLFADYGLTPQHTLDLTTGALGELPDKEPNK